LHACGALIRTVEESVEAKSKRDHGREISQAGGKEIKGKSAVKEKDEKRRRKRRGGGKQLLSSCLLEAKKQKTLTDEVPG
jgi:hypothetical protein